MTLLDTDHDAALQAKARDHLWMHFSRQSVMTDGPGEVLWSCPTGTGRLQPPAVEARDTLGAGDAFHGALVASLLANGGRLDEAVARAAGVASSRVQHVGARGWLKEL